VVFTHYASQQDIPRINIIKYLLIMLTDICNLAQQKVINKIIGDTIEPIKWQYN
jgi:hypothetical protein